MPSLELFTFTTASLRNPLPLSVMDAPGLPPSRFQRILFCTDFSESAEAAFAFAVDAAVRRPGAVLFLLHVIPEVEAQFWKSYIYEVDNIDAEARKRRASWSSPKPNALT